MTDVGRALVSVVVPCYRGEAFLAAALESCLRQTYPHLEIIVVDDASPDDCADIGSRFAAMDDRVRVIRHDRNRGVAAAFNSGFETARGAFMTRLAQDDVFKPGAIAAMVSTLEANPGSGLVYCDCEGIDAAGGPIAARTSVPPPETALASDNQLGLCVMWRRDVWNAVGRFNSEFDSAEDYDYWLRVREQFPLVRFVGEPQLQVRVHAGMGTEVFSVKQELLSSRIRARYASSRLDAHRIRQKGYFNAAHTSMVRGQPGAALGYLVKAACWWPFDPKLARLSGALLLSLFGRTPSEEPPGFRADARRR